MLALIYQLIRKCTAYQQLFDVAIVLVLVFALAASQRSKQAAAATEQAAAAEATAAGALVKVESVLAQKLTTDQALEDERRRHQQTAAAVAEGERKIVLLRKELTKLGRGLSEPIRLHFVVDCSLSLGDELPELKSAIKTITRVMTDLGREVSVSFVGYREQVVAKLPTTRILSPGEDRGSSTARLDRALQQLQAVGGYANVPAGFDFAFGQPAAKGGKEIVLWLADQDAREAADELHLGSQSTLETRLVSQAKRWATKPGTDRRVIAFYASNKAPIAPPLFKRLAQATPNGVFEDDIMNLLAVLLKATLPGAE